MDVPFFKQTLVNKSYIHSLKLAIDHIANGQSTMVSGSFAKFTPVFVTYKYFVFLSNGLDSLILALRALGIKSETSNRPLSYIYRHRFSFVDVNNPCSCRKDNLLLDASYLKSYCTPTRGIMSVHLYGNACDMDRFLILLNQIIYILLKMLHKLICIY